MKQLFTIAVATATIFGGTIFAAPPQGYYNSLEGKSGAELKAAVKAKVRSHKAISYGDNTWDAFKKTDVREVNGKQCWWDMYSSNNVPVSSGHPGMNIEHSVANSCWGGAKNDAYKDIVHLNPSDATANNRKSNYPLGIVSGTPTWTNGVTIVGHPASGECGGVNYVYEPHDMYKGDFARAYFYMFTVYDDISWITHSDGRSAMYELSGGKAQFKTWAKNLLMRWNYDDPVSTKEQDRNDGIYAVQNNRNPFIDIPDLADYIWGSKQNEPFHYDPSKYPENPDPIDPPGPGPDDPTPGTGGDGIWKLVRSESELTADDMYILLSVESGAAMSSSLKGTYVAPTDANLVVTDGEVKTVTSDIADVTLTKLSSGYAIAISEHGKNQPGYLASVSQKTMTIESSATAKGTAADISIASDGTATVTYGSAGTLSYNPSAPRFTTYKSPQKLLRFFKKINTGGVSNVADDLRREIWADAGELHIPAGASVVDLFGRTVVANAPEAITISLPKGFYIVVRKGSKAVKVAL